MNEFKLQSLQKFHEMDKLENYEVIQDLGRGTFGVVQKAKKKSTGDLVALKQLLNHSAKDGFPITAMREITILKRLHHKNILRICDMIYQEPKVTNPKDLIHQRGCFYTVSPYMTSDLVGLLTNPNITLTVPQIKCLMLQLLEGVNFIHESMFLHRDIKAANILIAYNGILKIGDFGLARKYHGKRPQYGGSPGGGNRAYTGLVVTRWYRAPELLLGEKKYTTAVDIWGIGCVFAEMFHGSPILSGHSDSHQAQLVFSLVGPPNVLNWKNAVDLPNKADLNIGITCKRSLEARFEKTMGKDGVDLLDGLLKVDPYKRLNAIDAIDHIYFKNDPLPLNYQDMPHFEDCHEIDKDRFTKMMSSSKYSSAETEQKFNSKDGNPGKNNSKRSSSYSSNHNHRQGQMHNRTNIYSSSRLHGDRSRNYEQPSYSNNSQTKAEDNIKYDDSVHGEKRKIESASVSSYRENGAKLVKKHKYSG